MKSLNNVVFDQNVAMTGDVTGMSKGGIYIGTIESVTVNEFGANGGTENTKLIFKIKHSSTFDSETGSLLPDASVNQFMDVIISNKDGDTAGMKKVHTLLGLTGQPKLTLGTGKDSKNKDVQVITNLVGLPIAYACFKKERWGTDKDGKQKIQYGFNLLHFFDASTLQTFSEKARGVGAETYLRKITDILEDPNNPPKVPGQKNPAQSPMSNTFGGAPAMANPPMNEMNNAMAQPNTMGENALAGGGFPAPVQ